MTQANIPPAVYKQLAAELKALRGKRRQDDVIATLLAMPDPGAWSVSKLSRAENALIRLQPDEVEDLCAVYEVSAEDVARLKRWARASRSKNHWQRRMPGLIEDLTELLEYESSAAVQRIWDPTLVPAICQTPGYAAAVISGIKRDIDSADLERRVDARLKRAEILPESQELHLLLDERVIRGRIGTIPVQIEQLRHLAVIAQHPKTTLQVVPEYAGAHPGLIGWFMLFEFSDATPDIGYTDGPGGCVYLRDAEDIRACTLRFGQLSGLALTSGESIALINRVIEEISSESQ
ncbi:helix-turn-helix transcriptional regulator [Saccharothrix violaceirubra]|uniref:DUF5753 domain-containing protein n=1 Tax=Saccharothrix violaceirubra TaxID=413306 RepID=A0A7W7T397_9PSEU|nr:DUF5753 domain-containing protein [Saccharothrix violaceirubra]MBB4965706.1 hypothetical protein [Saccharothrix violaceirubra]